jgi:cyclophilin family peptidyl-prolyl cis-trans isomerase
VGTAKRERQKANRQLRLEEMAREVNKTKRKRNVTKWGVGLVVATLAVILIAVLTGGDGTKNEDASTSTTTDAGATTTVALPVTVPGATLTGDTPCPAADGSSARTVVFAKEPPMCIDATKTYTAVVVTNKGPYTIALDAANAPKTVNNFVVLARYHYFDNTPCHRIISGFMAQCGDPSGTGSGGATAENPTGTYPGYKFADENQPADTKFVAGQVAMANAGKDTNGSQFFTLFGPYTATQGNYNLFGTVTDGATSTLKALEAAADPAAAGGVPTKEPISIISVAITES